MFYYLSLSAALFAIGLFGVLSKRSGPGLLVSLTVLLNAVIINFVVFNKYIQSDGPVGHLFTVFILLVSLFELLLGLAICFVVNRSGQQTASDNVNILQ